VILPLIVLVGGTFVVRLSLVITAVFFVLSSLPLFIGLKERAKPQRLPEGENYISLAFGRLWHTIKKANRLSEFIKFMVAFLIYNDGVIMALDFAAIIGAVLFGMDQQMLIVFVIIVQVTNVIGAYVFGLLAERIGCKQALVISLAMMMGVVFWMYFAGSMAQFFVIGAFAGFAMAGIQSVSRSLVGLISPHGQSAEFYGFFAIAGRTSSFVGPAVYGLIAAEAALWYQAQGQGAILAHQSGQRLGIASIGVFLAVGLVLLLLVNEVRARKAAELISQEAS